MIDKWNFYYYDYYMGRPKKDPSLRMDVDLRIPVTAHQKATIINAATAAGFELASWVRPILLREAEKRLSESSTHKGAGRHKAR